MLKEKLNTIGYNGDFAKDDIEIFLKERYNFNIRNVDCFTNIGKWNDYQPENVPDGYAFFCKDYFKNENENQWHKRMVNLAVDLIIKYRIKK